MGFGQIAATSQFYLYGRKHCTQTGYRNHVKDYLEPNLLDAVDLTGKVYMVTGANQGIGKEITQHLACRGATVYMVCRSAAKAEAARTAIRAVAANAQLHILLAECSLERDIRRIWQEFTRAGCQLDGLVCNARALLDERTLTDEGIEVTFASHLLFGVYLLGSLAMTSLTNTQGRLVIVSSGGMYHTKFPDWETAAALSGEYNGEQAYAYMKRGQVLVAERWAEQHPMVKVVSAHPGWAGTEAVDKAYANPDSKSLLKKSYLEPLRTPWEGAEGICWLLSCEGSQVETGAFYLDRQSQVKHMAGPFFSKGSFSKNSKEEVDQMVQLLDAWTKGQRPAAYELRARSDACAAGIAARRGKKLTAMEQPISIPAFMGKWHVIGHVPTFLDKGASNCTKEYTWDKAKQEIDVKFSYKKAGSEEMSTVPHTAKVVNASQTEWKHSVKAGPITIPFSSLIVHCDADYSTCIVGDPSRKVLYIMAREQSLDAKKYEALKNVAESAGYKRVEIKDVPQVWPTTA